MESDFWRQDKKVHMNNYPTDNFIGKTKLNKEQCGLKAETISI